MTNSVMFAVQKMPVDQRPVHKCGLRAALRASQSV